MVKILNKLALVGAVLSLIPVGLPFIVLNAFIISTGTTTIISVYPWGLLSEDGFVFWDILFLIQFMIPVVISPIIAVYGSTKPIGGKTIIGVAGFLSLFSAFMWFLLIGSLIGSATWTIPSIGQVNTTGYWSYGFYVSIAAGIVLILSIFTHPSPEYVGYGEEIKEPYYLEEQPYEAGYEPSAESIYCPYCGEAIPPESVFCPKCGTELKKDESDLKEA
ncbi:MAG: zinc ribbon domain-containing protein [Candidatus Odinarchaeia archaeon]